MLYYKSNMQTLFPNKLKTSQFGSDINSIYCLDKFMTVRNDQLDVIPMHKWSFSWIAARIMYNIQLRFPALIH